MVQVRFLMQAVRRIRISALAVVVLSTLVMGWVTQSPAFARSRASSSIFQNKSDCGSTDTNYETMGRVSFSRLADTVTISVRLRGATPSVSYAVLLQRGSQCDNWANLGTITTNDRGSGSGRYSADVSGAGTNTFYLQVHNSSGINQSVRQTLLP